MRPRSGASRSGLAAPPATGCCRCSRCPSPPWRGRWSPSSSSKYSASIHPTVWKGKQGKLNVYRTTGWSMWSRAAFCRHQTESCGSRYLLWAIHSSGKQKLEQDRARGPTCTRLAIKLICVCVRKKEAILQRNVHRLRRGVGLNTKFG